MSVTIQYIHAITQTHVMSNVVETSFNAISMKDASTTLDSRK